MKSFITTVISLAASLLCVQAAPTPTLRQRTTEVCGQYDTISTGQYIFNNDLWGEDEATSGSQCTEVDSLDGTDVVWHTDWTWEGDSTSVKSYANVEINFTPTLLDDIASINTSWWWSYSGSSVEADVSYDMFLGTSASTSSGSQYEVMIWLAALGGAFPLSSSGSAIASTTLADHTWDLYSGTFEDRTVYSFVATSEITSFADHDLKDFFIYLKNVQGLSTSTYYLQSIGAGTEAFTGSDAVFTTAGYKIAVDT